MTGSSLARQPRKARAHVPPSTGGLILVGGPPFQGKSVLAAHLAEMLPFAHKHEVVDNLSGASEHWLPQGLSGAPERRPLRGMLEIAVRVWLRSTPRPIVVLSARACSPASRRIAHRAAAAAGMKFLFVEARSHTIRAFERLSAMSLPKDELIRVMKQYDRVLTQCVAVDRDEMKMLPAIRLSRVLSDVDGAGRAVLKQWTGA
jgi:predicted kinase